jgi:hypothetical protein
MLGPVASIFNSEEAYQDHADETLIGLPCLHGSRCLIHRTAPIPYINLVG